MKKNKKKIQIFLNEIVFYLQKIPTVTAGYDNEKHNGSGNNNASVNQTKYVLINFSFNNNYYKQILFLSIRKYKTIRISNG